VLNFLDIDWTKKKSARCIQIRCSNPRCGKLSLHFTFYPIRIDDNELSYPLYTEINGIKKYREPGNWSEYKDFDEENIDDFFFFHQPSSDIVLDENIPENIKEALSQADSSQRMNLTIGASAALRKAIFEILADLEIVKMKNIDKKQVRLNYEERFDLLKEKLKKDFPSVNLELVNDIRDVYKLTSEKVHETLPEDTQFRDFNSDEFKLLFSIVNALLYDIYTVPKERGDLKKNIENLKSNMSVQSKKN
jgi:hypothetical protein